MTRYVGNSGDSHALEPDDLWQRNLPPSMRDRAIHPKIAERGVQEVYLDGRVIRRNAPDMLEATRPPGALEPRARLEDMDEQGVWSEVIYPSNGLWISLCADPELELELCKVYNDWLRDSFLRVSDRFVGAGIVPIRDVDRAISEARRAYELGYRALMLSIAPPDSARYNSERYVPLWNTLEELDVPICLHVGTGSDPVVERGAGAAVINYLETFIPAQRTLSYFVASGVLDAHPKLRLVFVEGGASWLAGVVERLDEGYRQHNRWARPKLSALPSEIVRRQVHVTFQHDRAALFTTDITGVEPLMWGSDYPHLEGTFPDTRKAVEEVFAGVPEPVRRAAAFDNLARVFGTPPVPTS